MKKNLILLAAFAGIALNAQATLVLSNSFGYADGPIDTVSVGSPLGLWTLHSGTTNQLQISSGQAVVAQTNSEDVSTLLTNATFPSPFTSGKLFASFTVNLSVAPAGSGGAYFFHYRD